MKRLNITLPEEVVEKLAKIPNKSKFIGEVLTEKFDSMRKKKLDQLLIDGYKMTCKEDSSLNKEWEEITLESWK